MFNLVVTVITIVMSEEQCQESSLTLEESNKKRQASPTEKLKLEGSEEETPLSKSVQRKFFFEECPYWSDTDREEELQVIQIDTDSADDLEVIEIDTDTEEEVEIIIIVSDSDDDQQEVTARNENAIKVESVD